MRVEHTFEPIYDERSGILILGTMPSVKSRETGFYYGHPQNRFWKVVAAVTNQSEPYTISEKKKMLLSGGIAIWDVVSSCEIDGSSDNSIRNAVPNDIAGLLKKTNIRAVFANGAKAAELYNRYCLKSGGERRAEIIKLPSTSPANAAWSLDRLIIEWGKNISQI